jgi:DNA-directed RNA polymerase sigma subunit (sigma70/sigma32)
MKFKPATWREIGNKFGVSGAAVQGTHNRMLKKLRVEFLKDPILRDWIMEKCPEQKDDK